MRTSFSLLAFLAVGAAHAQILLNIDMTDPAVTTITSTGGSSLVSSSAAGFRIRLVDFYASFPGGAFGAVMPNSGNLAPAQSTQSYNAVFRSSSDPHLTINRGSPSFVQTFVAGQQAFSGSMTANLSEGSAFFRTSSFVGNIELVNDFGVPTGQIVGQYSLTAVPEPATMTALGLGAVALVRRRRRR